MYKLYTAIATPFNDVDQIDYTALKQLLEIQIKNQVTGLVVNGTTAETPCLNLEEKRQLLEFVLENTPAELDIIVGVSSNSTAHVIEEIKNVDDLSFSTYMICPPYYNKTSQTGLICHIEAALGETKKQVLLYNVPSRTVMSFELETIVKLAENPQIRGIKEAAGDFNLIASIIAQTRAEFEVFNGNDDLLVPTAAIGCVGVISAISNALCEPLKTICQILTDEDYAKARLEYLKIHDLINLTYSQVNPIGVKGLMEANYGISRNVRLPLVKTTEQLQEKFRQELAKL